MNSKLSDYNLFGLLKPDLIDVVHPENNPNVAQFIFEPLQGSVATALGNLIRKLLFASLPGAAISGLEIENVKHEFLTIQGVKEDVTSIILNLKKIIIRSLGQAEGYIYLNASSEGEVTAGMIDCGVNFKIINADLPICTLSKGYSIKMKLKVTTGFGYAPAITNFNRYQDNNAVSIDAIYSPIVKCSFSIESLHKANMNDYNKLVLTIETNGATSPEEALAYVGRIMRVQSECVSSIKKSIEIESDTNISTSSSDNILSEKIEKLELSSRSHNCLKNENIVYIGDLVIKAEDDLLKTPNFGRKSLNEIKQALEAHSLSLGMNVSTWNATDLDDSMQ